MRIFTFVKNKFYDDLEKANCKWLHLSIGTIPGSVSDTEKAGRMMILSGTTKTTVIINYK